MDLKSAFSTAKAIGSQNEARNVMVFRIIIFVIIAAILIYFSIRG